MPAFLQLGVRHRLDGDSIELADSPWSEQLRLRPNTSEGDTSTGISRPRDQDSLLHTLPRPSRRLTQTECTFLHRTQGVRVSWHLFSRSLHQRRLDYGGVRGSLRPPPL